MWLVDIVRNFYSKILLCSICRDFIMPCDVFFSATNNFFLNKFLKKFPVFINTRINSLPSHSEMINFNEYFVSNFGSDEDNFSSENLSLFCHIDITRQSLLIIYCLYGSWEADGIWHFVFRNEKYGMAMMKISLRKPDMLLLAT